MNPPCQQDRIGEWSEIKLKIIEEYSRVYATILKGSHLKFHYIDAFCGSGEHVRKENGEPVKGSPLRVLDSGINFNSYTFIDAEENKINNLKRICENEYPEQMDRIQFHHGDCNQYLKEHLPEYRYEKYDRLLCLLDPYGLDIEWNVIKTLGENRISDVLINFPIMDINRTLGKGQEQRLDKLWGSNCWKKDFVVQQPSLFFSEPEASIKNINNQSLAKHFQKHLNENGKFKYVARPVPMRNTNNAILYYLFFATNNATAHKVGTSMFKKYNRI